MAYRRSSRYGSRSSAGYGRRRASGRVARGGKQQIVRLVIEQAPASGISRANERVLAKMNPLPGKAKL